MKIPSAGYKVLLALGVVLALGWLLPLAAPHDPLAVNITERLSPPDMGHWLGTDDLGRDVLSRVMYGVSTTVTISIIALVSALAIGVAAGGLAGWFYERWPDRLVLWLADLLTSIPFLVLVAAVLSIWGPGLVKAYFVLTAVMWTNSARIVRAAVIRTLPLDWVSADRAAGFSEVHILTQKVLPKCIGPALIFAVGYLPDVIGLEAGLSFLGLGLQPPQPGLGKMIFDGINFIDSGWWVSVAPGMALFLVVLSVAGISTLIGGDGRWQQLRTAASR